MPVLISDPFRSRNHPHLDLASVYSVESIAYEKLCHDGAHVVLDGRVWCVPRGVAFRSAVRDEKYNELPSNILSRDWVVNCQ
jgi:hypothetical protein